MNDNSKSNVTGVLVYLEDEADLWSECQNRTSCHTRSLRFCLAKGAHKGRKLDQWRALSRLVQDGCLCVGGPWHGVACTCGVRVYMSLPGQSRVIQVRGDDVVNAQARPKPGEGHVVQPSTRGSCALCHSTIHLGPAPSRIVDFGTVVLDS
jgi:hypothetical protein